MPGGRIADFTAAKHKPQLLRPKPCAIGQNLYNLHPYADVAKLVDAPDLGSGAERCERSSLSVRTTQPLLGAFFRLIKSNTVIKVQYWQGFQANNLLAKCLNTPNAI